MEERREIFDRFIEHRREDLQQEKKANLKRARKQFTELMREHFERNLQEPLEKKKPSLSVILTLLEDQLDADRFKQIQEDALAFLPLSVQEKLYTKVVSLLDECRCLVCASAYATATCSSTSYRFMPSSCSRKKSAGVRLCSPARCR